jgi:hypothetical protein
MSKPLAPIRLCDEGLAIEIDVDEALAPGVMDESSDDFGAMRLLIASSTDRVLDHIWLPY